MGTSTNAVLFYGYNLGGSDGWLIEEAGEYGEWDSDWYQPEDEDCEGVIEEAAKRLLAATGFTETDWRA